MSGDVSLAAMNDEKDTTKDTEKRSGAILVRCKRCSFGAPRKILFQNKELAALLPLGYLVLLASRLQPTNLERETTWLQLR